MKRIQTALHYGRGFSIVRGLDPLNYTEEERVILFAGITSYIAPLREYSISKGINAFTWKWNLILVILGHIRDRTFLNSSNDLLRPLEKASSMEFWIASPMSPSLSL